jgi:manganese/zinc/iron transport system substrate-binding protein
MFSRLRFILACCILSLGCSEPSSLNEASRSPDGTFRGRYPIHAVATVGMVADLVRNVGGEHVKVTQLMGSGIDPHLYKSTRDDMQTLLRCDMYW